MRLCRKTKKQLTEIFYNEMSPVDRREFEAHIQECPSCREAYARFSAMLGVMNQRKIPEPGKVFWADYQKRLFIRMERESRPARKPDVSRSRIRMIRIRPVWAFPIAAAACLVIGIWVGRTIFRAPAEENRPASSEKPSMVESGTMASLQTRTDAYLERSKVLLLGFVNFDTATEDPAALNTSRRRRISQDLVREAGSLKQEWSSTNADRKLVELISDLEVILLQIANLESNHNLGAVEIVKSGVDRRGILLKINIEEMRRTNADDPQHPPKESEKMTKETRT